MEMISGAGEVPGGGAEIFRALVVVGNCLLGEWGELMGDDMEEHRGLLRSAGLGAALPPVAGTHSSSGRGPRIEPPLAELTPDIAEIELRSSVALE